MLPDCFSSGIFSSGSPDIHRAHAQKGAFMSSYVVIDLEMCSVQRIFRRSFSHKTEIIQIGAVLLSENFQPLGEFSSFVCPRYGKIDHFIQNLTGISERDVKKALRLLEQFRLCSDKK